jgi:hypothetical protein
MKLAFLAIIVTFVFAITSPAQTPKVERNRLGAVKGRILDESGAIVTGARIVIERKAFRKEVRSDDEGYYEARLPVGKYKVGIPEGDGWYASGRKTIVIKHKDAIHNMVLKGIRVDSEHP